MTQHAAMPVIILLDSRLRAANHPKGPVLTNLPNDKVINVDGTTPIAQAVNDVATAARAIAASAGAGPIDLYIMAHGRASAPGIPGGGQLDGMVGGAGLKLCAEELTAANMSVVAGWKGLFRSIWLYACAAAYDETSTARYAPTTGTPASGRTFCIMLAQATDAEVIASDTVQKFDDTPAGWGDVYGQVRGQAYTGIIDFGAWEGNVMSFSPKTGQGRLRTDIR